MCTFADSKSEGMADNNYTPCPVDTSDVALLEKLNALVEALARNVHENWALGRINEGWSFGPERDDTLKKHPCLVDYDDLPETERDYDRRTAVETLKTIMKLGWKIESGK